MTNDKYKVKMLDFGAGWYITTPEGEFYNSFTNHYDTRLEAMRVAAALTTRHRAFKSLTDEFQKLSRVWDKFTERSKD